MPKTNNLRCHEETTAEVIRFQQKQIDELQRALQLSQQTQRELLKQQNILKDRQPGDYSRIVMESSKQVKLTHLF